MDNEQTGQHHVVRPRYKPAGSVPGKAADETASGETGQVSLIGADLTVTGNIEASDDLVIEGRVDGDVKCSTLIIGENGHVIGNIHAERVRLSGHVEGTVNTHDLAVESGARISGEILYSRLRVASRGIIEGQMTQRPAQEQHHDAQEEREPQPETVREAHPAANGKAEHRAPQDVRVFEDSSYRDDQRALGNGAS